MRILPAGIASALEDGATTLAQIWRVMRRDGVVFGFSNHDSTLSVGGLDYLPASARGGALEKSLGLNVDSASVGGALSSDVIDEDELANGVWDGARVDVELVDWRDVSQRVHMFRGQIGEVRRGALGFEAELRGMQASLNTQTGCVYSRYCDADVGDARCGVDLETSAFKGAGAIVEVSGARLFRVSGLDVYSADWFTRGLLNWDAGGASEVLAHRVNASGVWLELIDAPGAGLTIGETFIVRAGCEKSSATCLSKFANIGNFRGFPHMPGIDAMQSGPAPGAPLDGSSRWR